MSVHIFNKGKAVVLLMVSLMALIAGCSPSSGSKRASDHKNAEPVTIVSNIQGTGQKLEITFLKGKAHNHPTFAIWLEDADGAYIQTLFVTRAIGQGVFTYGDKKSGQWKPGEVRRPAALPYWGHKRGIPASDGLYIPTPENPVPDAYSGATPTGSFQLSSRLDKPLNGKVRVMVEINQTWDWNEFWTNNKFPDDLNYKTSCQPSLVYSSELIDLQTDTGDFVLNPIGHGHYSGLDGSLNPDLSTLTTAKQIASLITLRFVK